MSKELKIAALSLDIKAGDKSANIDSLECALRSIENDTDVVVLPELFSTGYTSKKDVLYSLAETNGGDTVAAIHRLSRLYNVAIAGSFLAKTGSVISNRAFFIEPAGDEVFYDKRHLFSMSSESDLLVGGNKSLPVVRYRGWNIAIAVCYDLRFPVWCRNNGVKYDLLVVVANWPDARQYAWHHLLAARAIENQSYVLGVDRSGEDKFGRYDGMTEAFDYCGKTLQGKIESTSDNIICYSFDHNLLDHWRRDFTAWKDADNFTIDL